MSACNWRRNIYKSIQQLTLSLIVGLCPCGSKRSEAFRRNRNASAGWLGSSWHQPARPQRGGLGSGGVALRASTPATLSRNPLLNHAPIPARFKDGRFRVTTEAKLRPLARFGCSIFRASVSRLKVEFQRIATSRIAEFAKRTMQRIVSVILPICVPLRNLRTRNLRMIHPGQLAQDRAWRCAPTDDLSGLLPPGLFFAHLTVPGKFSCAGLLINQSCGSVSRKRSASQHRRSHIRLEMNSRILVRRFRR